MKHSICTSCGHEVSVRPNDDGRCWRCNGLLQSQFCRELARLRRQIADYYGLYPNQITGTVRANLRALDRQGDVRIYWGMISQAVLDARFPN